MQFELNSTKAYLDRVKNNCKDPKISLIAQDLINELNLHDEIDWDNVSYELATRTDDPKLAQIISLAYNIRYADPAATQTVSFDEVSRAPNIQTWVAVHTDKNGHRLLLGTLRLVGGQIEMFTFFVQNNGKPFEINKNLIPFEFERLAFHPLLELTENQTHRGEIFKHLVKCATESLNPATTWLGCTMSPNVATFVGRLGFQVRALDNLQIATNDRAQYMLQHWPRYFSQCRAYEVRLPSKSHLSVPLDKTNNIDQNLDPLAAYERDCWGQLESKYWNLAWLREQLLHPATLYDHRPILLSYQEMIQKRILDFSDAHVAIPLEGKLIHLDAAKCYSLVESTLDKLQENLSAITGVIADYLHAQFEIYHKLDDKRAYGFYAFYFTRSGELESVVQFPPVPVFKLALTCSPSQLLLAKNGRGNFLHTRLVMASSHILVAGASVASTTAENLLRDGRVGYLTISDPKAPNTTNFNRTSYDALDVSSGEPKAISFARRMHRQDPTQLIYINSAGFTRANLGDWLTGKMNTPLVDVAVEAIDNLEAKLSLLDICGSLHVPLVQLSDVGSVAQVTLQNADDRARGQSLVFGLPDKKLQALLAGDYVQIAARLVGLENATHDEIGRFARHQIDTPFGVAMPQLGSTAGVAAGLASEQIIRFLLDRDVRPHFPYRRIAVDKQNLRVTKVNSPSLKERLLGIVMDIKSKSKSKSKSK